MVLDAGVRFDCISSYVTVICTHLYVFWLSLKEQMRIVGIETNQHFD